MVTRLTRAHRRFTAFTVFSLAPLMVIVIMIVGTIFGETAAKEQLISQLSALVGEEGAQLIATAIANFRADATGGTFRLLFNLINFKQS